MYWGLPWITQIIHTWILLKSRMPIARDPVGSILLLWFSLGISRTKAEQREGWVWRIAWGAEKRWKHTRVKELRGRRNGKERQNTVGAQLSRVSLNMMGVLYLSTSAGWNEILFCNIPSREVSPVLVLSNWRVTSVTTSVSGECVKYSNIKWSPFYSSSLRCCLPEGVPVPFSKAFNTL